MSLTTYNKKRHFNDTPEPEGKDAKSKKNLIFVVQRHQASHLHYDFRLEMEGVLKSWAVPKGPSMNTRDKRLAMMVEDHPVPYAKFAGVIPEGNYGAGIVEIWDNGTYELSPENEGSGIEAIENGSLKFNMHGNKLNGKFALVRMKKAADNAWLLIKEKDDYAVTDAYNSEDFAEDSAGTSKATAKPAKKSKSVQVKEVKKSSSATTDKLQITHPDKMYWPDEKITKGELIKYYESVYKYIIPYLRNRPQSMRRNPNGIMEEGFFQKEAGTHLPSFATTVSLHSESSRRDIHYLLCNNKSTLLYMANMGCIEINPWNSTIININKPDYLVLDLDPSDENSFYDVIQTAVIIHELLQKTGADCYCKTSGATGLHIYIPLHAKYTYDEALPLAEKIAQLAVAKAPELVTTERSLGERHNKLYIDYMQNKEAQTLASAYSARPKPGATVSAPLNWEEVKKGLHPSQFTIKNMLKRIEKMGDLFKPVLGKGINMDACLQKLAAL